LLNAHISIDTALDWFAPAIIEAINDPQNNIDIAINAMNNTLTSMKRMLAVDKQLTML
jgi:hypothetical protein